MASHKPRNYPLACCRSIPFHYYILVKLKIFRTIPCSAFAFSRPKCLCDRGFSVRSAWPVFGPYYSRFVPFKIGFSVEEIVLGDFPEIRPEGSTTAREEIADFTFFGECDIFGLPGFLCSCFCVMCVMCVLVLLLLPPAPTASQRPPPAALHFQPHLRNPKMVPALRYNLSPSNSLPKIDRRRQPDLKTFTPPPHRRLQNSLQTHHQPLLLHPSNSLRGHRGSGSFGHERRTHHRRFNCLLLLRPRQA